MSASQPGFLEKFKKYHFELKHLLVIFFVLVFFLILISFVHKTTLQELLINTQDWYQQDSAERMANLTATSLELLLETTGESETLTNEEVQQTIQAFNIILSQLHPGAARGKNFCH
jgi:predicted PurR-regulated permease PerM